MMSTESGTAPDGSAAELAICGICGSLRRGSFNRGLLEAAMELGAEVGLRIEPFERLREIPPYDQDMETAGIPEVVLDLKDRIARSAGLLIATPEYNYGVPGVLKNTIDWASRPRTPLRGKPTAILGASGGMGGTIRAQLELRQTLLFTETPVLMKPEILVAKAQERFDPAGRLTDQATRDMVQRQMVAFRGWIERMGPVTYPFSK